MRVTDAPQRKKKPSQSFSFPPVMKVAFLIGLLVATAFALPSWDDFGSDEFSPSMSLFEENNNNFDDDEGFDHPSLLFANNEMENSGFGDMNTDFNDEDDDDNDDIAPIASSSSSSSDEDDFGPDSLDSPSFLSHSSSSHSSSSSASSSSTPPPAVHEMIIIAPNNGNNGANPAQARAALGLVSSMFSKIFRSFGAPPTAVVDEQHAMTHLFSPAVVKLMKKAQKIETNKVLSKKQKTKMLSRLQKRIALAMKDNFGGEPLQLQWHMPAFEDGFFFPQPAHFVKDKNGGGKVVAKKWVTKSNGMKCVHTCKENKSAHSQWKSCSTQCD